MTQRPLVVSPHVPHACLAFERDLPRGLALDAAASGLVRRLSEPDAPESEGEVATEDDGESRRRFLDAGEQDASREADAATAGEAATAGGAAEPGTAAVAAAAAVCALSASFADDLRLRVRGAAAATGAGAAAAGPLLSVTDDCVESEKGVAQPAEGVAEGEDAGGDSTVMLDAREARRERLLKAVADWSGTGATACTARVAALGAAGSDS